MPRLRKFRIRHGFAAVLIVALWIVLSTGWSWFLITHAFERDTNARLIAGARQLAELARQQLTQTTEPPASQPLPDLENQPHLQTQIDEARSIDRDLAYAILWNQEGIIVARSPRDLRLSHLDSDRWPALDPQQSSRISKLTLPELAKNPAPAASLVNVIEATVPLTLRGKTIAYVSIAYPEQWLEEEFWRTQKGLLTRAGAGTLIGVLLLLIAVHFVIESLDKRRGMIQQTALARTSLLTERGMLASVLAHEVRSPLTALRFNLHSLRTLVNSRSSDIDRQVELTDRCEREIRRLDGMLNDFLQRTQVIGPVEAASVNNIVREAIEFLRPALERKNVRVSIHLDDSNPLVHVHPDELRQVILNLAANGQDAMAKGGTLAVSTLAESPPVPPPPAPGGNPSETAAPPDTSVTILIRDSGTGIPPELHERIFEPFFSTKPNGSGLGLALVRRVVSGAGGTVFCESVVGEGTTFRIVLPSADLSETRPVQAGHGYAYIHRDDPALELDESPELVIDRAAQRANDEARMTNDESNPNEKTTNG